jgi:hypothetical protein
MLYRELDAFKVKALDNEEPGPPSDYGLEFFNLLKYLALLHQ